MNKFPFELKIDGNKISLKYKEFCVTNIINAPKNVLDGCIENEIYSTAKKLYKKIFGENNFDKIFKLIDFPYQVRKISGDKYRIWYRYKEFRFTPNIENFTKIGDILYIDIYSGVIDINESSTHDIFPLGFVRELYFKTLNDEIVDLPLNPFFIEKI